VPPEPAVARLLLTLLSDQSKFYRRVREGLISDVTTSRGRFRCPGGDHVVGMREPFTVSFDPFQMPPAKASAEPLRLRATVMLSSILVRVTDAVAP
jgi:hypothetical protein